LTERENTLFIDLIELILYYYIPHMIFGMFFSF